MIIRKKIIKGQENLVYKKINDFNRKIERLKKNNQISKESKLLKPIFKEINEDNAKYLTKLFFNEKILNDLKKNYIYLEMEFDNIVNLNEYNILGSIKIDQDDGEYTLNSYSTKDLPEKYRNLDNPSKCEHCNTNRKRDNTYIIQNKKTNEMIQVGSSCMKDYIGKNELELLLKFNDIEKEIAEKKPKESEKVLYGKNEFLARAIKQAESGVVNKSYFNVSNVIKEMEENKYDIEEEYEDMADHIIDFYEDLNVSRYSDLVYNIKKIIASNSDFLTLDEMGNINLFLEVKNAIENKDENLIRYNAKFMNGVENGESENDKILYTEKDLLYVSKIAQENLGFLKPREFPELNTVDHVIMIINPLRLDEICQKETVDFKKNLFGKVDYLNKKWKEAKINKDVDNYYESVINRFENMTASNDFESMLKKTLNLKIEKGIDLREHLRKLIWVDVKIKELNKKDELKLMELKIGDLFDKNGEGFDEWELEIIDYQWKSSAFNDYIEILLKDDRGNNVVWRTTKLDTMEINEKTKDEWDSEYKQKHMIVSGKFKEKSSSQYIGMLNKRETVYFVKNLKIKDINENKQTNGEILLDKKEKYKVEPISVISTERIGSLNIYNISGFDCVERKITTKENLNLEKGKCYTIAYKGEKNLKNLKNEYIREARPLEEKLELTEKQMIKFFKEENKNKIKNKL